MFVPTDRAWASLLRVLRRSRDQLLADRDALVLVLRNHIAPGRAYSIEELKQLPYLERLPTLAGQPLMVRQRRRRLGAACRCAGALPQHPQPCSFWPLPACQVYTEAGQGLKVAATSRQIAFVLDKGLAGAPCADLVVAAHAVDAVLLPDPDWQVRAGETSRGVLRSRPFNPARLERPCISSRPRRALQDDLPAVTAFGAAG